MDDPVHLTSIERHILYLILTDEIKTGLVAIKERPDAQSVRHYLADLQGLLKKVKPTIASSLEENP